MTQIVVGMVLVPPGNAGTAWGHTEAGACVAFSGTRDAMLALFHRLRNAGKQTPPEPVTVDGADWEVAAIERDDCPIHALPEIEEGSRIAFAPY